MTEKEILSVLTGVLRGLLNDDDIDLDMTTRRADVPDWDSFAYVNFIAAAEMELGVKFRIADVESFETVGDIVRQATELQVNR